jgi:hypothetical protein
MGRSTTPGQAVVGSVFLCVLLSVLTAIFLDGLVD